jgi:hypothetical protein
VEHPAAGDGVASSRLTSSVLAPSLHHRTPQLLRDDAYIIGAYNADPRDLARTAAATASSSRAGGGAANVLSGQSRAVVSGTRDVTIGHGGGVPASQAKAGTNRWISEGLPASVALALAAPAAVKQIQLVFDTGMHRTLSYAVVKTTNSPSFYWCAASAGSLPMFVGHLPRLKERRRTAVRGPQPETVRDYLIEGAGEDGAWRLLCNVRWRQHLIASSQNPRIPSHHRIISSHLMAARLRRQRQLPAPARAHAALPGRARAAAGAAHQARRRRRRRERRDLQRDLARPALAAGGKLRRLGRLGDRGDGPQRGQAGPGAVPGLRREHERVRRPRCGGGRAAVRRGAGGVGVAASGRRLLPAVAPRRGPRPTIRGG